MILAKLFSTMKQRGVTSSTGSKNWKLKSSISGGDPPADSHLPLDMIDLPDNRVEILESDPTGQLQHGKYHDRYVRFERIHRDPRDQLARVVGLYRQMGDVAQVQKLFAIVENQSIKYALMEDMSGDDSIAKAIESGRWTALTQSEKFRIAYDLAATISALHAAGVVVKVIADHSVYLQRTPDGLLRPKLTNLRHARAVSILERVTSIDNTTDTKQIWEVTTNEEQDVRYQAPETKNAITHSKMSDIWA